MNIHTRSSMFIGAAVACLVAFQPAHAGVIFGSDGNLGGGFRWDAAARTINGNERSLDGGLRYSMQGGSLLAYRDRFSWNVTPTLAAFSTAIDQAFGAWTSIDAVTNLGTALSFVDDSANTAVVGTPGFGGININGAEIDLFGVDAGDAGRRGVSSFNAQFGDVTLTSGTTNYGGAEGGGAISGADVYMNANANAVYSLDIFRRLLAHELGHALGLGDVEDVFDLGFIDDNYSALDPLGTLTNSWALLVDPFNPAASTLTHFAAGVIANGDPGIKTPGVNILMESEGLGIAAGNPVTNLVPLIADDYGTRQFLYPMLVRVPEPSSLALLAFGLCGFLWSARRKKGQPSV